MAFGGIVAPVFVESALKRDGAHGPIGGTRNWRQTLRRAAYSRPADFRSNDDDPRRDSLVFASF